MANKFLLPIASAVGRRNLFFRTDVGQVRQVGRVGPARRFSGGHYQSARKYRRRKIIWRQLPLEILLQM
jgi:hypothetical protein